jgi:predicted RNA-binding protein YlxR (DUF448 family)
MAKSKRLTLMGDRVGAPFSAWRIKSDYSVTGVTLYACNDKNSKIGAKQAYTARGSWVCPDTKSGEYYTDQRRALEIAHERAIIDAHAAHEAYLKASKQARNARDALRTHTTQQGENDGQTF